ncbi:MAG: TrbC/VirB2 family protein [Burkholderiaceae bacterium]|nr:TrbC/VirB2 family protein [Burkholderiaceae bacterium]
MPSIRNYLAQLNNRLIQRAGAASMLMVLTSPAMAAGGLAKAQSTLQMIKDNLELILPIAAVIIGLIIVVLYMAEIMRKDDMVRWLIGLVIAGSIGEIVVLLWK